MKNIILSGVLMCVSMNAISAWDATVSGKIKQVDVESLNGDNAGFRVRLEGSPELCGNEYTWAYINKSDQNYDVAVSVLLAAKMSK